MGKIETCSTINARVGHSSLLPKNCSISSHHIFWPTPNVSACGDKWCPPPPRALLLQNRNILFAQSEQRFQLLPLLLLLFKTRNSLSVKNRLRFSTAKYTTLFPLWKFIQLSYIRCIKTLCLNTTPSKDTYRGHRNKAPRIRDLGTRSRRVSSLTIWQFYCQKESPH
jgi:hypothetical protein